MSAEWPREIEDLIEQQAWTDKTLLTLLADFIEQESSMEKLGEFLFDQSTDENDGAMENEDD